MAYLLIIVIFAVWVFVDASKRKNNHIGWPVVTLLVSPVIALPVYLAKRHLKEDEVRKGGTGWNVIKNFAVAWTITIIVASIVLMAELLEVSPSISQAKMAGMGWGLSIGVFWFVVLVVTLALGFFLKKNSVVERGPTGPLAEKRPNSQSS